MTYTPKHNLRPGDLLNRNRLRQRLQHMFDHVVVDDILGNLQQPVDCLDVARVAQQTAVQSQSIDDRKMQRFFQTGVPSADILLTDIDIGDGWFKTDENQFYVSNTLQGELYDSSPEDIHDQDSDEWLEQYDRG